MLPSGLIASAKAQDTDVAAINPLIIPVIGSKVDTNEESTYLYT